MSADTARELKSLETRLRQAKQDCAEARAAVTSANAKLSARIEAIKAVESQIESVRLKNGKDVIVSEHAVLRLLERVYGVDIDGAVAHIKKNALGGNIANGKIKSADGYTLVIKNGTVVTVEL